ncbi:MAG: glycerol-3-phosphate 1-O-acyltransferase PlsY [Clostridia bacterium]|nr:glycerol-3-phosphate 1-O-acyltransferase PlsY [Clostridia bacterium]
MGQFFHTFFTSGFVYKALVENEATLTKPLYALIYFGSIFAVAVIAYLLGSLNFAIIISGRRYKEDIRSHGSKNAGMTNMMRTYGKSAAALTLVGDALKAVVSCLVGYAVFGLMGAYIAGLFCIVGHMFPIFYRFKGGKGVVTAAITILMCNPFVFLILFALFVIIVLFTKYISLGSIMCMLLYPLVLHRINLLFGQPTPEIPFVLLMTVLVVFKHRENIGRLLKGKESKFSFKKSVKAPEEKNEENK